MPTALAIAQGRQAEFTTGLFLAILTETPLLSAFDARTARGTRFLSLAVVNLPTAGGFHQYGQGFTSSTGDLEVREFGCALTGGIISAEVITAERWDAEHAAAGTSYFDLQTELKFVANAKDYERQLIHGRSNDADGFPGLRSVTPFTADNKIVMAERGSMYDYTRSVLDVEGNEAGKGSSVYGIRFGEMDAQLVIGGDASGSGELVRLRPMQRQMLAPDPVNKPAELSLHDLAQMDGHLGLAVGGHSEMIPGQRVPIQYAVRRMANLTTQAGKTLDDEKCDKFARMFGTGKRPHLLAMSERSGEQLAKSRAPGSIVFQMGAGDAAISQANIQPDPPDNWRDIPIVYPEPSVIGDTDAIEAAA